MPHRVPFVCNWRSTSQLRCWSAATASTCSKYLLNLVLNGLDAMADTPEDERRLVVSTAARNGQVDLAVRDAGSGIAEHIVPRLFDPFFTTKRDGMGMGLSVVRSIVEAHNGRIEAHNNAGRGATLRVSLPVRKPDAAAPLTY